jgi:hypothetical protein
LHRLEFANALELGIFRGHYSRSQVDQSWNDLLTDIRDGRLKKTAVDWPSTFRIATQISRQFSTRFGSRSLDLLQVSTAKLLDVSDFMSFDLRQAESARAIGLRLIG